MSAHVEAATTASEAVRPAGRSAERVTISLTSRVAKELRRLRSSTGLSKTDLVNRAVSLYALAERELDQGRELAFYDPQSGEYRHVHLA